MFIAPGLIWIEESPREASCLLLAEMLFSAGRFYEYFAPLGLNPYPVVVTKHPPAGLRLRARNKESDCSYHR